jgi:hypothetical protein
MARIRKKAVPPDVTAFVTPGPSIHSVMVVRVKRPVWLHTHKAQPGETVTVDPELGQKLIETGAADGVTD